MNEERNKWKCYIQTGDCSRLETRDETGAETRDCEKRNRPDLQTPFLCDRTPARTSFGVIPLVFWCNFFFVVFFTWTRGPTLATLTHTSGWFWRLGVLIVVLAWLALRGWCLRWRKASFCTRCVAIDDNRSSISYCCAET